MTLIHLIARDLRIAARTNQLFRWRLVAATSVLLLAGFFFWCITEFGFIRGGGRTLFLLVAHLVFFGALIYGAIMMAPTISGEKANGTLGLLFLTPLSSFEVVAAKFLSGVVRAFYDFLPLTPLLGVAVMLGGVEGREFAKLATSIFSALFFSLSIGLISSSVARKPRSAVNLALGILLFLAIGLPIGVELSDPKGILRHLPIISPFVTHSRLFENGADLKFWAGIGCAFGLDCLLLVMTWVITMWSWRDSTGIDLNAAISLKRRPRPMPVAVETQEKEITNPSPIRAKSRSQEFQKFRERLLNSNPIAWLLVRIPSHWHVPWLVFGGLYVALPTLALAHWMRHGFISNDPFADPFPYLTMTGLLAFLYIYYLSANTATAAVAESRENGSFELLLGTPIDARRFYRGMVLGLRRTATPLLIALVLLNWTALAAYWIHHLPVFFDSSIHHYPGSRDNLVPFVVAGGMTLVVLLDLWALPWLALRLGLRLRKTIAAPLMAFFIQHFPPFVVFMLTMLWLVVHRAIPSDELSGAVVLTGLAVFASGTYNALLFLDSRRSVLAHFRTVIDRSGSAGNPLEYRERIMALKTFSRRPLVRLAVGFLVLLVVVIQVDKWRIGRAVASRLRAIQAKQEPIRSSRIRGGPMIAVATASDLDFMEAATMVISSAGLPAPELGLTEADKLTTFVSQNRAAAARLHELLAEPSFQLQEYVWTDWTRTRNWFNALKVLDSTSRLHSYDGRPALAWEALLDEFRLLTASAGHTNYLYNYLSWQRTVVSALDAVEFYLKSDQPPSFQESCRLGELLTALDRDDITPVLLTQRADAIAHLQMSPGEFARSENMGSDPQTIYFMAFSMGLRRLAGLDRREMLYNLDFMNLAIDASRRPLHRSEAIEEFVTKAGPPSPMYLFTPRLLYGPRQALEAQQWIRARLRGARLALEVENYRMAHEGRIPTISNLDQSKIPLDPETGEPLSIKPEKKGYTIHCSPLIQPRENVSKKLGPSVCFDVSR